MSKHTPGPWTRWGNTVYSSRARCAVVRLPALTDAYGDETPEQIERWDADARLIAAAPGLLNLAELVVNLDSPEDMAELRAMATKLIAKIRGEE